MSDEESLTGAALALARTLGFEYCSTALGQPLEVARILLQVQWCPRPQTWRAFAKAGLEQGQGLEYAIGAPQTSDSQEISSREKTDAYHPDDDEAPPPRPVTPPAEFDAEEEPGLQRGGREFGAEDDELSNEDEAATYFHDLLSHHGKATDLAKLKRREVDESGYVVRDVVQPSAPDATADPDDEGGESFVGADRVAVPIQFKGGLWAMGRAITKSREGWQGLFKGLTLTFIIDEADRIAVPLLEQALTIFAAAAVPGMVSVLAIREQGLGEDSSAELILALSPWQAWLSSVLAHSITGLVIAPVSTLRTRAIVQTSVIPHRKYGNKYGTGLSSLRTMAKEEGGWLKLWTSPRVLIPALLDCTLRPACLLATPLLVDQLLPADVGVGAEILLTLACQTASLLITLPIETIRRRLQAQPIYDARHHAKKLQSSEAQVDRPTPTITRNTSSPSVLDRSLPQNLRPTAPQPEQSIISVPSLGSKPPSTGMGFRIRIKGLRTCVETRPLPYAGLFDGLYKVLTEETDQDPSAVAPGSEHLESPWPGLPSLYRGFSIAFFTLASEAALALLVGESSRDVDTWAEI